MWKRIKEWIRHFGSKKWMGFTSFQIILLLLLMAMLFLFGENSVAKRWKYEKQIRELKSQVEYYRRQSEQDRKKLNELQSNKNDLEKFARENYFMKRDNEDLFIID